MKRKNNGQYRESYLNRFAGLYLLITTVLTGVALQVAYTPPQEPISPLAAPITPVHATEPTPAPRTKPTDVEGLIRYYFVSEGNMAVKVAFCESSLNPYAEHSKSSARGLFQIMKGTWEHYKCQGSPVNAEDNILCAYKIYQDHGWDSTASWRASRPCWSAK